MSNNTNSSFVAPSIDTLASKKILTFRAIKEATSVEELDAAQSDFATNKHSERKAFWKSGETTEEQFCLFLQSRTEPIADVYDGKQRIRVNLSELTRENLPAPNGSIFVDNLRSAWFSRNLWVDYCFDLDRALYLIRNGRGEEEVVIDGFNFVAIGMLKNILKRRDKSAARFAAKKEADSKTKDSEDTSIYWQEVYDMMVTALEIIGIDCGDWTAVSHQDELDS